MTETMLRTALGEKILRHWREHCPQMVRDLERQNRLDLTVLEAQETTGDLLYELVSVKKMNYPAAWELAAQEWALPESGSEEETTSGDHPPPANPAGTTSSGTSTRENSASATSQRRRPPLRRATSG